MKIELGSSHITHTDSNIFTDLGFSKDEAEILLAKSQIRIDQRIRIKCQLIYEIKHWINENSMSEVDAAKRLMTNREVVSDVINQRQEKFTIDSLVSLLIATGKSISLTVHPVICGSIK